MELLTNEALAEFTGWQIQYPNGAAHRAEVSSLTIEHGHLKLKPAWTAKFEGRRWIKLPDEEMAFSLRDDLKEVPGTSLGCGLNCGGGRMLLLVAKGHNLWLNPATICNSAGA